MGVIIVQCGGYNRSMIHLHQIHNYARLFLQLLETYAVDTRTVLRASGLTQQQLQHAIHMPQLVQSGLRLSAEPGLGLRFGEAIHVNTHGVFSYALMSSATIGDVLKLLLQYNRILVPELKIELVPVQNTVVLRCQATQLAPELERFFIESFFTAVINFANFLLPGVKLDVIHHFHYPPPSYAELYAEMLGGEVTFNAEFSERVMPKFTLALPNSSSNPATEAIFREQCDALLKELGGEQAVSARVQQLLLHRRGDFPKIGQAAEKLHMSESTLRRRLQAEGNSFQQLLDQVRLHLASQYLTETEFPVAEVGRLIGFDDVANFRRSFRRWSGKNPSQLRRTRQ